MRRNRSRFTALLLCLIAIAGVLPAADGKEAAEVLMQNRMKDVIQRQPSSESDEIFLERFDLRDRGVVTPVKLQNPWSTCWGFSAIAASETSILSSLGKTYAETGLDLSEHHLTYFARTALQDGSSQDDEGIHMFDETETFDTGGFMFTATSLFSSGVGVVNENLIPYRGRNSLTERSFFVNEWYSEDDDWTLPEEYRFIQNFELVNSDILPSPAVYDNSIDIANEDDMEKRNAAYLGYDQRATDAMKRALMEGKAISIAYSSDTFLPSQLGSGEEALYINTEDNKWTHYTYDAAPMNHAVTIVGWDDTIRSSDFLDHSEDEWGDGEAHQPEGDGAWIVKNSWGARTEDFPNWLDWGIENEDGRSTGYFYLSYYDRSINLIETFDFSVVESDAAAYDIAQYDYLQTESTTGWLDRNPVRMANVFEAEYDTTLRALSCETDTTDTQVFFSVYLLDEDASSPEDGELVSTAEASFGYPGYHRISLLEPVAMAKGQRYSVVVTSVTEYEGTRYYGISTSTGISEDYARQQNIENNMLHQGLPHSYYSKGVVNEGESFVYIDELGSWTDFADVIPYLREYDDFEGTEFDNFPIKAYLDLNDPEVLAEMAAFQSESYKDIGYKDPASRFSYGTLAAMLAVVLLLIFIIVEFILSFRRKKKIRQLKNELAVMKQADYAEVFEGADDPEKE